MSSTTTTLIIPESLKNADPVILAAAQKWAEEQLAKQIKKADAARKEKVEKTPEQKAAAELKAAKKAFAVANKIKTQRVRTTAPDRKNGKGKIHNSIVFDYCFKNKFNQIFIHKGKQTALEWLTVDVDCNNHHYTVAGKIFKSLSDVHKDFAGVAAAVKITLNNSYFVKERDGHRRLSVCLPKDVITYEALSSKSSTTSSKSNAAAAEPVADESDAEESDAESDAEAEGQDFQFEDEEAAPAPAPAPAAKKGRKAKAAK